MPPLGRAVALAEVDHASVLVGQDLHLDVAGAADRPLQVDAVVGEGGKRLPAGGGERLRQLPGGVHTPHPAATRAGGGLDEEREADPRRLGGLFLDDTAAT